LSNIFFLLRLRVLTNTRQPEYACDALLRIGGLLKIVLSGSCRRGTKAYPPA
jgi:hypothetical protein